MCNYYYLPQDRLHSIEIHEDVEAAECHAVCFDCNRVLCDGVTKAEALEVEQEHKEFFLKLSSMESAFRFMPRCECYSSYMATLSYKQFDAELERTLELEEFIDFQVAHGTDSEADAAFRLESDTIFNPVPLSGVKLLIFKWRKVFM